MTEYELVRQAIASLNTTPRAASEGQHLTMEASQAIVDQTIALAGRLGKKVDLSYLKGHRRRLVETLSMIPTASFPEARFLDVGCYGYMAYWAHRHLGYGVVEGVEWIPGVEQATMDRLVEIDEGQFSFVVHNFDISRNDWPLESGFDTIILLETLEHVNHDPAGVVTNIAARLRPAGTFVSSVPNSVSYKTLQEFMIGAPPWNYWFFHPDLEHEPRHVFEYTPIFFKSILRSAGLREVAFRTICAFQDVESLQPYFAIGEMLSIPSALFGDTMIAVMIKDEMAETVRFPALIYDKEAYYKAVYPLMLPRLEKSRDGFFAIVAAETNDAKVKRAEARVLEAELRAAHALAVAETNEGKVKDAEARVLEADARATHALALCAEYLRFLQYGKDAPPESELDSLIVEDWGAKQTRRGEGFNPQPDGNSALWIRLQSPPHSNGFVIRFGQLEKPEPAYVEGNIITSAVPQSVIDTTGDYPVVLESLSGQQFDVGTLAVHDLIVDDWGAKQTRRGEGFNPQPDGNSALWIRLQSPPHSNGFVIRFGQLEKPEPAYVEGNIITSAVPQSVIDTTGDYPVVLESLSGHRFDVGMLNVTEN